LFAGLHVLPSEKSLSMRIEGSQVNGYVIQYRVGEAEPIAQRDVPSDILLSAQAAQGFRDYYRELSVDTKATAEQIEQAYDATLSRINADTNLENFAHFTSYRLVFLTGKEGSSS